MSEKIIPIYGKKEKGKSGYTIFIDLHTKKVYRAFHKEVSQSTFMISFFATIILMRFLTDVSLPDFHPFLILIFILTGASISVYIGMIIQKKFMGDLIEIYPSEPMVEDFIDEGSTLFKREVIIAAILLLVSVILVGLFIIYNWLVWLLFSFMSFAISGMMFNSLSIDRWKLYKYRR
ncbi:hypothetical protein NSA56_18100 [Oceanobacillus caeni]|uniref:hypothetical protein n=1 Tax=Oceanobacillus TaxID=182709 RepID=UPI0019596C11|nr:hypothetical protein [Oceanobacillus caeni]MBU8790684.1 hypothetical protein [Oceanobacillus caeni]MCR1836246.1 hypothetical protein [Oceanobacillus caeni]